MRERRINRNDQPKISYGGREGEGERETDRERHTDKQTDGQRDRDGGERERELILYRIIR